MIVGLFCKQKFARENIPSIVTEHKTAPQYFFFLFLSLPRQNFNFHSNYLKNIFRHHFCPIKMYFSMRTEKRSKHKSRNLMLGNEAPFIWVENGNTSKLFKIEKIKLLPSRWGTICYAIFTRLKEDFLLCQQNTIEGLEAEQGNNLSRL